MTLVRRARRKSAGTGDATTSTASDAASAIQDAASTAWEKVAPTAGTAWEKVAPAAEDAYAKVSEVIVPVVKDASSKVAPYAGEALAQGRRHGRRAAVKLRLAEEPKPKSHRLRKLLAVLGIAGAVTFVYKKMSAGGSGAHSDAGQPGGSAPVTGAHSSAAQPAGASNPDASLANETAPAAPLAAEETKTSAVPTDPDNPTETTDVS
jgi:hypothetical protein